MKTAVIYARYSSERQTEQSIEGQLRICNDYAERNEIVVVNTYIDRAMTGTNDNRTSFQRMLKDSSKKAWDLVLVYKLDRFSRNKYEMAMHKRTLRDNGIRLVSAMENIPDTPEGIILESLLEGMAEYYSAELSQKVRRGMNESRRKGNTTGGHTLFGYRLINKKYEVYEPEAQIVRRIFEECASGKPVKNIIFDLEESGVRRNGKPLARNVVYNMLANEKYAGIYRFNGEIFTNMFPRIVPEAVFDIVKAKIDDNKYGKHKPEICYLLKNKLTCGYCGKPVNSDSGTSKSGKIKRYYKCSGKRITKSCSLNPIRKELIEKIVVDAIYDALATPELISNLADKILILHKKRNDDNSVLDILMKEYARVQKAIDNLLTAMENGIITSSTKERLEQLEMEKAEAGEKLAIEKSKVKLILNKNDIVGYLQKGVKRQPRQMINILVKEIKLYNDKVRIFFNYTDKPKQDNVTENKESPDGDDRQDFCFFSYSRTFSINTHGTGNVYKDVSFDIQLYI